LGMHLRQDHLQDHRGACKRSGRDPPPHSWLHCDGIRLCAPLCVPAVPLRSTAP
jgi:hypothetical protein